MATKFGFLSRLEFLQNWASMLIANINPVIVHNLEKYHVLKKVHYFSAMEDIKGDYLEFGVYTGSSFCYSIRCCKALFKLNPNTINTKFYGFDSFLGFGNLKDDDKHPFYTDENFTTSVSKVSRRIKCVAKNIDYQLIQGYFNESLAKSANQYGIERSRIIFIDSDTYTSASEALIFCMPTIQEGTFIILDDYFSYKGSKERGVALAFSEFLVKCEIQARHVFTYGMSGLVYVISGVSK